MRREGFGVPGCPPELLDFRTERQQLLNSGKTASEQVAQPVAIDSSLVQSKQFAVPLRALRQRRDEKLKIARLKGLKPSFEGMLRHRSVLPAPPSAPNGHH